MLDENDSAEYLTKSISDTQIENMLKTLMIQFTLLAIVQTSMMISLWLQAGLQCAINW